MLVFEFQSPEPKPGGPSVPSLWEGLTWMDLLRVVVHHEAGGLWSNRRDRQSLRTRPHSHTLHNGHMLTSFRKERRLLWGKRQVALLCHLLNLKILTPMFLFIQGRSSVLTRIIKCWYSLTVLFVIILGVLLHSSVVCGFLDLADIPCTGLLEVDLSSRYQFFLPSLVLIRNDHDARVNPIS